MDGAVARISVGHVRWRLYRFYTMSEKPAETSSAVESSGRTLAALVALLAADRDERADEKPVRRSEVVLSDAGFSYQEIARLTGKKIEAVRSTLRRAKKASATEESKT
jgi:DNA-directed RNA polymerase specialized sigma24 family protein